MVGGESSAVEIVMPLLHRLGKTIIHQGGPGCGQHTKMVNQVLIATNMIGVCEALLYAYRAGLDLERVMESVASGAAGSWSLSNLGPRIIANNFEPGFFVDHFLKDMRIARWRNPSGWASFARVLAARRGTLPVPAVPGPWTSGDAGPAVVIGSPVRHRLDGASRDRLGSRR